MRPIPKPITILTVCLVMIASLYIVVVSSLDNKSQVEKKIAGLPSSTPEVAMSELGLPGVKNFSTEIAPDIAQKPIHRTLQINGKKYLQQQVKVSSIILNSKEYQVNTDEGETKTVLLTDKTLKATALYGYDVSGQRVALQYDTAVGDKFSYIKIGTPVLITFAQDLEQNYKIELSEFVILDQTP